MKLKQKSTLSSTKEIWDVKFNRIIENAPPFLDKKQRDCIEFYATTSNTKFVVPLEELSNKLFLEDQI